MRTLKHAILALAILFSVFASAKTNAPCYTLAGTETVTLPSSVTPVLNLSVCTQYNMTYNLTYSGIAGLLSDNLTFNLPLGITASSLSSFSGSGVTANFVSGGANPVVSVSGWQAGSTLTLVLSVSSPSCGAVAPLNVVTKISGGSNNCAPFSVSNSLTIPVPNLFVTNTASNVLDKNIGDVDEIVFQIANSSNNGANIPQININYTNDPNTTPLGNYYISNSPAKQPGNNMYTYVPATASTGIYVPSTGGTSVVMDHTIFGYFFSGATTLADGNSLYLHIPYKVTGCTSPNTGANYTFSWGCGSAPCSSIPLVTTVNVEVGDPQMRVTSYQNNTNASYCSAASGSSYQFGFEYTNMGTSISGAPAGNAMATGIKLYPFSTTTMGAVDPTSLYFSDGAHTPIAIPQSIITPVTTGTGLGYTTYEINFGALTPAMMMNLWNPLGPNSLADLDGDGFIDDMAEGSTLLITGNFIYNQNTTPFDGACTGLSNYFAPAISSKYQNQCQSIPATDIRVENYPWENAAYYLYQISRRSSSMTAPSDVIAGTPFKVNICPIYYEDWFPLGFDFNCPHGYHDIHIPLPSGFHFDHTGLVSDGGSGWLMSAVTPTDPGCSGPPATIIPDAIETPEDLSTCTPGYLDIKLGRIPFGSCSGVASQTYELPCMDIPLVDNCSGGTTCGTNFGPDILTFTLEYICDPGCSSSVSTLACGNTETYHHCGGRCDSYFGTDNPVSFKRVNLGALNPPTYYGCTSNLPVPLTTTTSPAIDVSAGYPGDVIEVQATGTFNGSPSSTMDVNSGASYTDMYLQIQYDALPAGTIPSAYQPLGIFDFDNTQGNVKVFDGTTLVASVPASAITITPSQVSGVNLLNLNFSAALTNMTSSTITYTLVTDLYLIIKASPPISGTTTFFASGFFPLVNLRMQYAGTETPNTLTPNKVDGSCDSYGAPFTIEQPGDSKSYDFAAENSCDLYYANFEVESSSAKWGTLADDFPNEYRPYAGLDPALSINIPPGYMLVNATYRTIRTPIGTAPNNFDTQGSYQFVSYPVTLPPSQPPIGTPATGITIFFNGIDGQGACWPGLDDKNATWKPIAGIQLELQPLCTALPSDHFAFSGSYTEGLQQSNALYQHTTSFSGPIGPTIHHVNPLLSLNGPVGTINAYTNTVSFNFQYCNTGTIGANNAWVAFENNPAFNALDLSTATVQTVPGGVTLASNVYVDGAGHQSLLVNTGSLPVSTCLNFVLTASINANGCVATGTPPVQDFVSVIYGNECTGAITSPDPSCEVGTTTFTYDRYPSNLELLETSFPSGPVDLCDGTLNYNLVINSSDLGSVSDPSFWLDLPPGISVQSASFTLGCSGTLHTYTSTSVDGNHFG
ncbi:MAG TPA: hypothetical protein VNZ86_19205, partial [Bacteroidia bacterium]|nr:hypothetical protein [Bacteroidia bacterium]